MKNKKLYNYSFFIPQTLYSEVIILIILAFASSRGYLSNFKI